MFDPGAVGTVVTPAGGGSVIDVLGVGTGPRPFFNELVGLAYFGLRNDLIRRGCDAANGIPRSYD